MHQSPPPIPVAPPPQETALAPTRRGPFGPALSFGIGVLIYVTTTVAQALILLAMTVIGFIMDPDTPYSAHLENAAGNGDTITAMIILGSPIGVLATVVFVVARRGPAVREYLGLVPAGLGTVVGWCLAISVFQVAGNLALVPFQDPDSKTLQFMTDLYTTATVPALLWFAVIVVAPVFEEILFRGFMFEGLAHSRLGASGASFVTAALWAVIHIQYDVASMVLLFVFGLALGMARAVSGSLYVPIAMHMIWNTVATVMTEIALQQNL